MTSMLEIAGALCAGAAVAIAVVAAAGRAPLAESDGAVILRTRVRKLWLREAMLAASASWSWLDATALIAAEVVAAICGAAAALLLTGLPALSVAAAVGGVAAVRVLVGSRIHALRTERQDAVLEAVRMLRQLLETGAGTVQQAIAVLAERGPLPLRRDFRIIAATSLGRRQAWTAARDRIGEPLFDMLAAAVLIQGPGGGELAPLFAELEATVTSAQEVEREAEALQVQARSASAIIVSLPVAFLLVLSTFRSPYLDAFHNLAGESFLIAMLAVMGCSYFWMRRLLRLDGLQRVRLTDA
jgi:Flp pilus assembly protein TadB